MPLSEQTPIIMIGPGCGLAPFIGYCEEREFLMTKNKDVKYGPLELYFGCRRADNDFIYQKEITAWKEKNVLTGLYLAFSREKNIPKVYVQDLIRKNRDSLYKMLREQNAVIHICGSLVMGDDIRKALIEVLLIGEKNPEEALENLEKSGRIIAELWG